MSLVAVTPPQSPPSGGLSHATNLVVVPSSKSLLPCKQGIANGLDPTPRYGWSDCPVGQLRDKKLLKES
jgi:hypothetical protein